MATLIGTADANGNWTATYPTSDTDPLLDGKTYSVSAIQRDRAGFSSPTKQLISALVIDTAGPTGTTGGLAAASDSGNGVTGTTTDNLTNNNKPTLSGAAEPGATVEVTLNGKIYTTTADPVTGAWTVTVPNADALPDSTVGYTPSIKVTDTAGNSTTTAGTLFKVDTTAPLASTIAGGLDTTVAGQTATVGGATTPLTGDNTPVLSGASEPGSAVSVTINGKTYTSLGATPAITVNATTGAWTLQIPAGDALPDGTYAPSITTTDAAGNSTTKTGVSFVVDATAPLASSLTGRLSNSTDTFVGAEDSNTGISDTDTITNDVTPQFNGQAEPYATVTIYVKDGTTTAATLTATADANGIWSVTSSTLAAGKTYTIDATQTDKAGNTSASKTLQSLTIDTAGPTVEIAASDVALAVGETSTLTFTFNEDPGTSFDTTDLTFTTTGGAAKLLSDYGTVGAISGSGRRS